MPALGKFTTKLIHAVYSRVYLAPEFTLCIRKSRDNIFERRIVGNHYDINVAGRRFIPFRDRTVDEGNSNRQGAGTQCLL